MNVGDRVKGGYGIGTILEIKGNIALVKFLNPIPIEMSIDYLKLVPSFKMEQVVKYDDNYYVVVGINSDKATIQSIITPVKNQKKIVENVKVEQVIFLNSMGNEYTVNGELFKVGSEVKHDVYGTTKIIGLYEKLALLKYANDYRMISYSSLEKNDSDFVEEFIEFEKESDEFIILPSNYSDSEYYSTSAKNIMTWARRHFKEGIASVQSYVDNANNTMGIIIVKDKGVIVFKILEGVTINNYDLIIEHLPDLYSNDNSYMINKFLNSKTLCSYKDGKFKILNFPLRFVYVLQNVKYDELEIEQKKMLNRYNFLYCRNFSSSNQLFSNFEEYNTSFTKIKTKLYPNIIERVIPENCTLFLGNKKNASDYEQKNLDGMKMVLITGKEREFSALNLDDEEIRFINNTKQGHWLTLANPGTGKSVVLLSKAYRLLNMNDNSKILITCYNNNLCEHHTIFAERTGLRSNGLYVNKFFKMIFTLLDDYHINYDSVNKMRNDDDKYERAVDLLFNYVSQKNYLPIFDAIFIDEVQLFKPKWILLCKKMLKEHGFFELYGDLNQNVRTSEVGLKSPWKDKCLDYNWTGHVRYLEKNYRNTQKINDYLNDLIRRFNTEISKYKKDFDIEDTRLTSISSRENKLEVKIFNCVPSELGKKVAHFIEQVHEKWHADYDDIAVIFPASYLGDYRPFASIKAILDNNGVPNCQIFGGNEVKSRLNDTNGVVFSTIDSSLGLDFKFVLVCGTAYWNYYWSNGTKRTLTQDSLDAGSDDAITKYCEIGRKIYSACSRAREGLIIIDDLPSTSPVKNIIKKRG